MHIKINRIISIASVISVILSFTIRHFDPLSQRNFFGDLAVSLGILIIFSFLSNRVIVFLCEQREKTSVAIKKEKIASAAKTEFLSNMSHEIRTPINSILGMNEMILRESEDKEIKGYAKNIQTSGNALLSLVNQILDLSKIEAGKMEIVQENYSLDEILKESVSMVKKRIEEKKIEFEFECQEDLPSVLKGDSLKIKQILLNILTNAAKYTKQGKITFRISGEKLDSKLGISFSVKDTGIGISDEDKVKIFGRFERFNLKENRSIEGAGLGLRISKHLAELMGGEIDLKSELGKGSEFILVLVQEIIDDAPVGKINIDEVYESSSQDEKYEVSFVAPDAKVLVVDDIEMNLFVIKSFLKETLVQLETVSSGEECVKKACEKEYDVIFIDHMMPGMDGIETFKRIRSLQESKNVKTPCIMFTANAISGAKEKYEAVGFEGYITKPVQGKVLEEQLQKYLPAEKNREPEKKSEKKTDDKKTMDIEKRISEAFIDFDFKTVLENCAGKKELLIKIIQRFTEELLIDNLEQSFAKEDWAEYAIYAHSLKGSARTVGMNILADKAYELELAGKASDEKQIKEKHRELIEEYLDTVQKLKECIN